MSIRKLIVTSVLLVVFATSANAQFSAIGVRAGLGFATISDDLFMNSTLGYNIGGYANYSFSIGALPEMELQSGLFLARRGAKMVTTDLIKEIEDICQPWYLQIPLKISYTYRLPISDEHFVSVSVGPAANIGLFGKGYKTVISPEYVGIRGEENNSQSEYEMFDKWNRIDVSILIGFGYRFRDYTFDFIIDSGLLVPHSEMDALVSDRNSFTGTQKSFIFSLGYYFSLK
jgi:hypothetical protein